VPLTEPPQEGGWEELFILNEMQGGRELIKEGGGRYSLKGVAGKMGGRGKRVT